MDDAKKELVQSWLIKATHDIKAAEKLAHISDPVLDVAIYHCQQGAEKAIKGFLVFHDQQFEKTHDIEQLLTSAGDIDKNMLRWIEAGEYLSPYVSLFRYPGAVMEPSEEEFEHALFMAKDLFKMITSILPKEVLPTEI